MEESLAAALRASSPLAPLAHLFSGPQKPAAVARTLYTTMDLSTALIDAIGST